MKEWNSVDWKQQDIVIAKNLGVTRERVRQVRRSLGLPNSINHRMWTVPMSEQQRQQLKERMTTWAKGHPMSDEHKSRLMEAARTFWDTDDGKRLRSELGKKLGQLAITDQWREKQKAGIHKHDVNGRRPHSWTKNQSEQISKWLRTKYFGEKHFNGRWAVIRSPNNVVYRVKNVTHFVREHTNLFDPEDVIIKKIGKRKNGKCNAASGLLSLFQKNKTVPGSWKGWTAVSDVEKMNPYIEDLLGRVA